MNTKDLFKVNRKSRRINESIEKTFGKKLNLEAFDLLKLEDARNKLRTQISQVRSTSGFNENLENDAYHQAQWMLDAINAEIAEREELVADPGVAALDEAPADTYETEYMFTGDDGEEGYGTITYEVVDGKVDPASLKGYCEGDGNNKLNDDWCTEMVQPGGYEHEEALAVAQEDYAEQSGNQAESSYEEGFGTLEDEVTQILKQFDQDANEIGAYGDPDINKIIAHLKQGDFESATDEVYGAYSDQDGGEVYALQRYVDDLEAEFEALAQGGDEDPPEGGETDDEYAMASAGFGSDEDYGNFPESTQGEDMHKVTEGEIQQASAIVSAKTMVDRVGRWIEELSGMENDTLLQLGDQIRDEMGAEQAKTFISAVAPAIQTALDSLKQTRETLATGVRTLTGEEQSAEMLGSEPEGGEMDMAEPAAPDEMNAEPEVGAPEDEFAAAEPAAGGLGDAGREKRESIDYQNRLLKVLAG
jgi:hypothetical protein